MYYLIALNVSCSPLIRLRAGSNCLHKNKRLTSLGNGTRSVHSSHIESICGLVMEWPVLRGSFQVGGLEGTKGCAYSNCFGDIRCGRNFSKQADERLVCYWSKRISEVTLYWMPRSYGTRSGW
ncbi:hypothetical protein TNCV_1075291 [Trichonephila clavipes]|uniref:Uncharacterized protein n=1 Tax=Trichonephila clavipes TaxID=2585209 RepID=A0A8X6VLN3_TRICX|nr:hypothetical protein TNCV_1075291 [Trichonephila clavipes]